MPVSRAHLKRKNRERQKRYRQKVKLTALIVRAEIPKDQSHGLALCKGLSGAKTDGDVLLMALEAYAKPLLQRLEKTIQLVGLYWPHIRAYLPVAGFLIQPGVKYRYGGKIYSSDDWLKIQPIYAYIQGVANTEGHRDVIRFCESIYSYYKATKSPVVKK